MPFRWLAALTAMAVLLVVAPPSAGAQQKVALVVGNGAYRNATPLANPPNDAADVAAALRRLGFAVIEGRDLDKHALEDKIRAFGRALDGASVALFFYAGHGLQVAGRNYLVPVDAKLERPGDLSFETIDVGQVLGQMEAEARVNLVFLDACRDNPLARTLARSLGARSASVGAGLASIQSAVGTMIAYATQPDNVALDGEGRNSPFTTALLKHLPTPGLDVAVLMRRIRSDVVASTHSRQVPWDHSSLIGDVVLVPGSAASAGTEPPAQPSVTPPPVKPPPATSDRGQDVDIAYWNSVKDTGNVAQIRSYIAAFPNGTFVALARLRIEEIESRTPGRPTDDGRTRVGALEPAGGVPPRPQSPRENCASFNAPAGVDLYCASSVLQPQLGNTYGVRNLFGGDISAAWVEGAAGDGTGEWVTVAFDGERTVRAVVVNNGYEKSTDLYVKNGRVQTLRLVFSTGESRTVTLQDRLGPQTIALDRPVHAHWVQFVIDRTYRGTTYTDTAISKLAVFSDRAR
ncbi:MAG: caspase family protein [Rhodoplanes sp.]|uniref:NADase-type glycan-binding domain-containing protein n=1 Tax=Rhodoplanes sp. TaxID=1968906 RepID=UPI0017C98A94|nr:caspase family protein [Rhodoplanes sp.]NVO14755.1 caspase family protein [Rhodoplanes sp.]